MDNQPRQFELHPSSGTPIYRQIVEQVHAQIAGGHLEVGSLLPSVRTVAKQSDINPMTVSKAYSLLETEGAVERVRGQGMRILPPQSGGTLQERKAQLLEHIEPALHRAAQLGLSQDDVRSVVEQILDSTDLPTDSVPTNPLPNTPSR